MSKYAETFRTKEITGAVLMSIIGDQALREKVEIKSEIDRNEILSQITRLRSGTKNTELERESMSKSEEMYRAALGREKDRKLVMEQEMFEQHKILHAAKITPRALAKIPVQVYPLGNWESFLITLFEGYKMVYIYLYIFISRFYLYIYIYTYIYYTCHGYTTPIYI